MSMNQISIIIVNLKYSSKRLSRDSDKASTDYLPLVRNLTEIARFVGGKQFFESTSSLNHLTGLKMILKLLKDESLGGTFSALY